MRVLFTINSLGSGGTERSTALLLPHLRDLGVEATVVCLEHRDQGDERQVRDDGFDVAVLAPSDPLGRIRALRRLIADRAPAVVHTAIFEADQLGRLAAAGTGVPVLGSLVNTPYVAARRDDPNIVPWKLNAVRRIDSLTARTMSTHFHAVTEGVATDAVQSLGLRRDRITVVERGRDPDALGRRTAVRRAAARAELGVAADAEVVIAVGRQEYQKGHVHLVEAIRRLADERPGLVLFIVGRTGNASTALHHAVHQSGLGERVRLLGYRDDVADLLCGADVFALPSLYDGTAGAAIEALALDVPIVSSDLAGTRGVLVDDRTARLVPAGDPRALARALVATLDHPPSLAAQVARGRAVFEDRFTLTRSAERMAALYERVAGLPSRPRRVTRHR